jgi:hypothetical protein
MALEDDLIGGPADESVWFPVKGADYEIDLSVHWQSASAAASRPAWQSRPSVAGGG